MKIKREDRDGVVILRLDGKLLGGRDSEVMRDAVMEAIAEGKTRVLLDMEKVPLVNSTGLGILVTNHTTLKRSEGVLKLLNVPTRIASALQMTWLNTIFESFEDEDAALASFDS